MTRPPNPTAVQNPNHLFPSRYRGMPKRTPVADQVLALLRRHGPLSIPALVRCLKVTWASQPRREQWVRASLKGLRAVALGSGPQKWRYALPTWMPHLPVLRAWRATDGSLRAMAKHLSCPTVYMRLYAAEEAGLMLRVGRGEWGLTNAGARLLMHAKGTS